MLFPNRFALGISLRSRYGDAVPGSVFDTRHRAGVPGSVFDTRRRAGVPGSVFDTRHRAGVPGMATFAALTLKNVVMDDFAGMRIWNL